MKAIRRQERSIKHIIEEFNGLKRITQVKTSKRKSIITHMTDMDGKECTDRQGIADIFALFYQRLYCTKLTQEDSGCLIGDPSAGIPPFQHFQLQEELKGLKNGRTRDKNGVFAELLKFGGPALLDV